MLRLHFPTRWLLSLTPLMLVACAGESPLLDARWGQSLTQAQQRQTAYPDKPDRLAGPTETSGSVAHQGILRYHQSFENPPPPVNVLNLGMGTGTGLGQR